MKLLLHHANPELGFTVDTTTMAGAKMAVVAFLLVSVLVASAVPAATAFGCFPDCYNRCANGDIGNVACSTMCSQACIVPKTLPDGTDLATLYPGGH